MGILRENRPKKNKVVIARKGLVEGEAVPLQMASEQLKERPGKEEGKKKRGN